MKIAYCTLDEVNRFFVTRWLHAVGVGTLCPAARSLTTAIDAPLVVLDFDSLPPEVARAWLQKLLTGQVHQSAMVHGHNLTGELATALRSRGVRVCRSRLRKSALVRWASRTAGRVTTAR